MEEHWSNAEALLKTSNPRSKKAESYLIDHGLIDPQQINIEMAKFIVSSILDLKCHILKLSY